VGAQISPGRWHGGKSFIVEDESMVALELRQKREEFGRAVTGLAESADAAWISIEECRPDPVLTDIGIGGPMNGIRTARILRDVDEVPVAFLTSNFASSP
jgi:DNA-binding NarL/FixJ family response regulator